MVESLVEGVQGVGPVEGHHNHGSVSLDEEDVLARLAH
jgi:hypothetical protein